MKAVLMKLLPYSLKRNAKRTLRKLATLWSKPLSIETLRSILIEKLNIEVGDTLLVHSSFGILQAQFSPDELIEMLITLVGESGNVLMPYYPPEDSYKWLVDGSILQLGQTKSSMGIVTTLFSKRRDVCHSIHPIKSVTAWGKDKEELVATHHFSKTPFDNTSPYYKLLSMENAKSIGIGIERISFFHACQDALLPNVINELYHESPFPSIVEKKDGEKISVKTYCHKKEAMKKRPSPCELLKESKCPNYKLVNFQKASFYSVPVCDVFEHSKRLLSEGVL